MSALLHSFSKSSLLLRFATSILLIGLIVCPIACAQEAAVSGPAVDSFPIPEDLSTAEELFNFLVETSEKEQPQEQTMEVLKAHNGKVARTVLEVVNKARQLEPNAQEVAQAYAFELQAWDILSAIGEPGAQEKLDALIEKLRNDKQPQLKAMGTKHYVESGIKRWPILELAEKQERLSELTNVLTEGKADPSKLRMVLGLMDVLERYGDLKMIEPVLQAMVPLFQQSSDSRIAAQAELLAGVLRRVRLPGSEMELSGDLLDGGQFDVESLRGKVVLVNYFASWCVVCRQELPGVKELYQQYKDRGFEVVGISLDDTKSKANAFVRKSEIPWKVLFEPEDENGVSRLASQYGIMSMPQCMLLDQEGKVVSLMARGPELQRLLRDLLGEP